jgi:hypothetical protein
MRPVVMVPDELLAENNQVESDPLEMRRKERERLNVT